MSYYPPPPGPRRLQRSRSNRWIGGVCGGLAEYLNMDPTLVRVLVVLIAVVTAAVPVIAVYLLMMVLIPEEPPAPPGSIGPRPTSPWQQPYSTPGWGRQQQQPGDPGQAPRWTGPQQDPVWGPAGPPWQQPGNVTEPTAQRPSAEDLFSRAKHPTRPTADSAGDHQRQDPGSSDAPAAGDGPGADEQPRPEGS